MHVKNLVPGSSSGQNVTLKPAECQCLLSVEAVKGEDEEEEEEAQVLHTEDTPSCPCLLTTSLSV